jgi:hypothetical protein
MRILMILSYAVFLWMFLSAEPLEVMADLNLIHGPAASDAHSAAYLFAARWRHGMTEGWLLYMPGFFAVAMATWFWSLRRSVRRMAVEAAALIPIALLIAMILQPAGTASLVQQFRTQTSFVLSAPPPGYTHAGILRGIYTLLTFQAGIVAIERCLALRRLWPLGVAIAMNVILALVRPWTVGDFTGFWIRQVLAGDPIANFSFWLIPCLAWIMYRAHRSAEPYRSEQAANAAGAAASGGKREIGSDKNGIEAARYEPVGGEGGGESGEGQDLQQRQLAAGVYLQSSSCFPTSNVPLKFAPQAHEPEDKGEVGEAMEQRRIASGHEHAEHKS